MDDDLATSTTRDESGDAGTPDGGISGEDAANDTGPATGDPTAAVAGGDGIGSGDDAAPKRRRGRPKGSAA